MIRWAFVAALLAAPAAAQTEAEIAALVDRVKAEFSAFAGNVATCSPFTQDFLVPGTDRTMERSVVGEAAGLCEIRLEAAAAVPTDLVCKLGEDDRQAAAAGWQAMADNLLPTGEMKGDWPNDTHPDVAAMIVSEHCQAVPR